MKHIFTTILAFASILLLSSCNNGKKDIELPKVTTLAVQTVSSSTAVLRGSTTGGTANMLCRGVCFSESDIFSFKDSPCVSTDAGEGEFAIKTYELKPVNTYHMKAFAVMKDGTIVYGEEMDFSTSDFTLPSVKVDGVTDIFATEATLNGSLIDEGDYEVSSLGFVYAAQGGYETLELGQAGVSSTTAKSTDGSFSATIADLKTNTKYDVRAFANCEQGTGYSDVTTFSTPDVKPVIFADIEVTENEYTALSIKSAITDKQGSTVKSFGFVWSKTEKLPSLANATRVDLSVESDMSYSFEGVRAGSVYYVRAFAQTNEIGNCYGALCRIKVKTYNCNDGMIKIIPNNPVFVGWLGDYDNTSLPAKYKGAHDGDFLVNQSVNRNSTPTPSEATLKPYCIAKYEVTNRDFVSFLNYYGSATVLESGNLGRPILFDAYTDISYDGTEWTCPEERLDWPVVGVTFFGATAFCEFFGGYLPNEAQWENAARGNYYSDDPSKPMYRYSGSDNLNEIAIWASTSTCGGQHCEEVGKMKPNQLGIYDMSGNAQEMTSSGWGNYSAIYKDISWTSKNQITLRGGRAQRGVANTFQNCTRDALDVTNAVSYSNFIGFRFACDPDDED